MTSASETTTTKQRQTGPDPKKDRWVPWYFVMFFAVIALVDSMFVYFALSTHTGVVTQSAYEKGLNYNQVIDAEKAQAALGWKHQIQAIPDGTDHAIKVIINKPNSNGITPIDGLTVSATITRPLQGDYNETISLPADTKSGVYLAPWTFPMPGQWDISIAISGDNEEAYHATQRVVVHLKQ